MKPFRGAVVLPKFGVSFLHFATVEEMQSAVGATAYVNEDGVSLKLPANPTATRLLFMRGVVLPPCFELVGPLLVAGPVIADGDITDISPALEKWLKINTREG